MNTWISCFAALGERMREACRQEADRRIMLQAEQENPWFTQQDIARAISALCDQMLVNDKLKSWLAHYPAIPVAHPRNILVVMAGNIPLVGFFDLLCVACSGHACWVKPSAKDKVLITWIVELLHEIEPRIPINIYDGSTAIDAVIATGGENANRYFKMKYADVPSLLRGSRQSVAVLSGRETSEELEGLSDDIWAYSGLGCRNVSMIFLPEKSEIALKMPPMNPKYLHNYRQTKALLTMQGTPFIDMGGAVMVEQKSFPTALSEISYAFYHTTDEVASWLALHDEALQCVVTNSLPHSRGVPFGKAQSPELLDYPDACDVMAWLAKLS